MLKLKSVNKLIGKTFSNHLEFVGSQRFVDEGLYEHLRAQSNIERHLVAAALDQALLWLHEDLVRENARRNSLDLPREPVGGRDSRLWKHQAQLHGLV